MKDSVVFTFGRFNPPTIGHQKLVDTVKLEAGKRGAEPQIYLSHSQDKKKNPLDYNTKIKVAQSAFGPSVKKTGHKDIINILKMMSNRGVKNVVMVVGSDRVKNFDQILTKYNGKDFTFDSVRVISAGQRDPDADGVEGMSASKIRSLAIEGDFNAFKSGLAKGLSSAEAKKIYNKVRAVMEDIEVDDAELDLFLDSVEFDDDDDLYASSNGEYITLPILAHDAIVDQPEELTEAPLTIQQRLKKSRQMRRLAPKIKRRKELLKKKMASPDKLQKRSRKAAVTFLKKKFAGKLGANYASLSASQKIAVDRLVQKKMKDVGVISKRLLPKIRKKEQERLKKMRSQKNEQLEQRFQDTVVEMTTKKVDETYYDPEHMEQRRKARERRTLRGHIERARERGRARNEEVENLDEVSRKTLRDYIRKGEKDIQYNRDKATYAHKVNNIHNVVKHHNKAVRRQKQVDKAKEKFSGKNPFDEEVELDEARNPHPMGSERVVNKPGHDWHGKKVTVLRGAKHRWKYGIHGATPSDQSTMQADDFKSHELVKEGVELDEMGNMERVRTAIAREKNNDRQRWDRMRDRARIKDARTKNRQTRLSTEEVEQAPVTFTGGHPIDKKHVYKLHIDGEHEGTYHSKKQVSQIVKNRKKTSPPWRKYKVTRHARSKLSGPVGNLPEEYIDENEQVDELSTDLLKRYVNKASKDTLNTLKKSKDRPTGKLAIQKRRGWMNRARDSIQDRDPNSYRNQRESVDVGPEPTAAQNKFADRFRRREKNKGEVLKYTAPSSDEKQKHREEVLKKGRAAYFSSDKYKAQLAKRKIKEEHGAGEFGTKKPVKRFKKETPGEGKKTMPDHPLWSAAKYAVDRKK